MSEYSHSQRPSAVGTKGVIPRRLVAQPLGAGLALRSIPFIDTSDFSLSYDIS